MLLNMMRSGAKSVFAKILFSVLLLSAVAGLALMDVGGFFRRGGLHDNTVAKIGREKISSSTFDAMLRQTLSRQGVNTQTAYQLGLVDQALNAKVSGAILYHAAYELGIETGEKTIVEQVNQLVAPLVTKGMTAKEALRRILQSQNMTEGQFVQALQAEIANTIVRNAMIASGDFTPDREARDLYQYQNQQISLKALILPHNAIRDYKEPGDEILKPFYEAGQERYAIPETRAFSLMVLTKESARKNVTVSDDDLKQIYERDIATFTTPEQRVLEQAVFPEKDPAEKAAAGLKNKISMKDAVKAAGDFKGAYLGTQTFQSQGLADEIAEQAFRSDKGAIIGPVQTPLGWHVLVVKDIIPQKVKPLDSVKEELRKEALQSNLEEHIYQLSGSVDDQLAGGAALEDVAKSLGLSIKKYGPLRMDGSTLDSHDGMKDLPDDRDNILKTAFSLAEGESSPIIEMKDGSYAALRTDKINEKSYKPFEQIRGELKAVWIQDQQEVLNKARATELLQKISAGESMEQVAQENGLNVQSFTLKRKDNVPDPLTLPAKTKFFELPKDGLAISTLKNGYVIGQVKSITLPPADKLTAADLKSVTETATQGSKDEYFLTYLQFLRDKYGVWVNRGLLERTYGPGSEQN